MALDIGTKAIGIAVSDPAGWSASTLKVLPRDDLRTDIEAIVTLAGTHEVEALVVGYPINMDGTLGPAARRIDRFIEALRQRSPLPIHRMDERLSTREAFERMAGSPRRQDRRRRRDELAAAIILQRYLEKEPLFE